MTLKRSTAEQIREKVFDRHWELFESRVKSLEVEASEKNPTESKETFSHEPYQRWLNFTSKLMTDSNENQRLISLFRKIWLTDWKENFSNENFSSPGSFIDKLSLTESDKKLLEIIARRST